MKNINDLKALKQLYLSLNVNLTENPGANFWYCSILQPYGNRRQLLNTMNNVGNSTPDSSTESGLFFPKFYLPYPAACCEFNKIWVCLVCVRNLLLITLKISGTGYCFSMCYNYRFSYRWLYCWPLFTDEKTCKSEDIVMIFRCILIRYMHITFSHAHGLLHQMINMLNFILFFKLNHVLKTRHHISDKGFLD